MLILRNSFLQFLVFKKQQPKKKKKKRRKEKRNTRIRSHILLFLGAQLLAPFSPVHTYVRLTQRPPINMHHQISPAILYWGTPVVLITSENTDGTSNIAPMSSAWWLGDRCMIGLSSGAHTSKNILRTKQCVLNLPSEDMTAHVNALARTTGANPTSAWKASVGYRYVKDKFAHAKLTPQPSELVVPCRILECPVQMEAELVKVNEMMGDLPERKGSILAMELKILRVYVEDDLRLGGYANRIDSEKWQPLIMCFSEFYGMGKHKLVPSRLAEIDEEAYRSPRKNGVMQVAVADEKTCNDESKDGEHASSLCVLRVS
ncbi:uncharacterized protein BDCG_05138 [Blastomyces dermatitidis ER-3]|uniref:Flavin reductase like domain-containing protein n=1 Tax=Ajellomyces dermatitidis (strain ER-3 / ATCC MYA-2586) TaxID=559297 RepID=A0ABP2F0V2_AJEDR|nr:uncharacterized protein BDCG_05138 [Blastomyces dermatitidis ER-3]EEQ90018.2 hypothetical protein BDCG_05138 [Blastomyces dermatitidis ER-3]